jgi:hypothetical protein
VEVLAGILEGAILTRNITAAPIAWDLCLQVCRWQQLHGMHLQSQCKAM